MIKKIKQKVFGVKVYCKKDRRGGLMIIITKKSEKDKDEQEKYRL